MESQGNKIFEILITRFENLEMRIADLEEAKTKESEIRHLEMATETKLKEIKKLLKIIVSHPLLRTILKKRIKKK